MLAGLLLGLAGSAKAYTNFDSYSHSGNGYYYHHVVVMPSTCWIYSRAQLSVSGTVYYYQKSADASVYGPPSGVVHHATAMGWGDGYWSAEKWNLDPYGSPNGSCQSGTYGAVHTASNPGDPSESVYADTYTEFQW